MGVLDKYLKLPTTKQTTTKNVYDTVVSVVNKEEEKKALQNIQAELENKTALFPKKPGNYDEMIANDNYNSEYKKVRTELGIDILNANLEKHIAEKLAEGTGIDEYKENLARVEMAPQFEKMRTQLEKNEAQIISRIGKEKYVELYNEIDSKTRNESKKTNTGADFEYGKMQIESSLAWNDYLNSGLYLDKARAIAKDEELNKYYNEHYKEIGNSIFSGTAEYLPQAGYQLKHNAPAFIVGGIAGGVTGIVSKNPKIGLKTGQVVTGIGSAITSSTASYDLIRGGVYRDLVKMGVDENIAKDISADSAFWQSVIEGIETGVSIFNLFKNPATSSAKQTIKEYLKGYGINIITEGLEEGSQEIVGIAYEKSALEKSGLNTSGYDIWNNITRVGEATLGGMEIAITIGGTQTGLIMSADSVSKVKTKNDIKKNITNYYDNEIKKNKGNEVKISELQKAKEQATSDKNVTEVFNFIMSEEGQRIIKEQQDSAKKVQTTYKNQKNNQEFLNSLQEELRETTDPNAEIKVENSISKMHANAKTQVERTTKGEYEVVYYTANNLEATMELNEAVNTNAGKRIFVNANMNAKDTYSVIGHGLGHFIISKNPDILTEFKKKITPEQLKTYNETLGYQIGTETDTPEVRETKVLEELFVDYLGELFSREDVVKRFEKETMTTGEKIADIGKNFIANTTGIDTRSKVSAYNMSGTSKLQGNIIQDKNFENEILKILSTSNKATTPKVNVETDKKLNPIQKDKLVNKEIVEQELSDLQEKYDEMKESGKKQLEIKKMIAKELGVKNYDSIRDRNNGLVNSTYEELKNNYEERMMYSEESAINEKGEIKFSKKVDKDKAERIASETHDKRVGRKGLVKKLDNINIEKEAEKQAKKTAEKLTDSKKIQKKIAPKIKNETIKNIKKQKNVDKKHQYLRSEHEISSDVRKTIAQEKEKKIMDSIRKKLKFLFSPKIYSKLGNEWKELVDEFKDIYLDGNSKKVKKEIVIDYNAEPYTKEYVKAEIYKEFKGRVVGEILNGTVVDLREKADEIKEQIKTAIEEYFDGEINAQIDLGYNSQAEILKEEKRKTLTKANVNSLYSMINPTEWLKDLVKLISKEMAERPDIIVSDKVLKAIENPEQITLANYGTKEDLQYLESLIDDLMNDIADMFVFRGANIDLDSTKQEFAQEVVNLAIPIMQKEDMVAYRRAIREAKLTGKLINTLSELGDKTQKVGNEYIQKLSNLHTILLAMANGNPESALFIIEKFLRDGTQREKQAIVELQTVFDKLKEKDKFGRLRFKKDIAKMIDIKSEWIETGITYIDSNGYERVLRLPKSMILSLAMHAKNNDNLKHITGQLVEVRSNKDGAIELLSREGGGLVVPNERYYKKGDLQNAYAHGRKIKLTVDEVNQIVGLLTEDELAFLDVVEEFYKVSTKLINETSNKLLGYDLATVDNYFPIRVSFAYINRMRELLDKRGLLAMNQVSNYFDIVNNFGFLKERSDKAFQPIYLENIADVITRSTDGVSKYYGHAIALYDNNLMLNANLREAIKIGSESFVNVQELLAKVNSSFSSIYNDLTAFMIGAKKVEMGKLETMARTLHAKATFNFNVRAWLKNFGALFSTLKYHTVSESLRSALPHNSKVKVDNKIRTYLEGVGVDTTGASKKDLFRTFIVQVTPEIEYRGLNYTNPEVDSLLRGMNIFKRMDFIQGMSMVENLTVTAIARMETFILSLDDSLEFGSDEFVSRLKERIETVIAQTQQVNAQVDKGNIARESGAIAKGMTVYSSDSLQLFNLFTDSALELKYYSKTGDKAKVKKAWYKMQKTVLGMMLNFATVTLISNMGKEDDDEELFDEDFWYEMLINMLSPTLFLDDIATGIMAMIDSQNFYSFDISLPELDFTNALIDTAIKFVTIWNKEESKKPKAWVDIIKGLGTVTGIPTRDLLKWYVGLLKFADSDAYKQYSLYVTPNAYKKWLENTDMEKAELYEVYEATREKKLISDFGYVKKSKKESEQKKQAMRRAIQSVTTDSRKVKEYMEIFGGYKS